MLFEHISVTMTLDEWFNLKRLRGERVTETEFGALAGIGQPHVNRLRKGKATPTLKTAQRISEVTGGLVTANDFQTAVQQ